MSTDRSTATRRADHLLDDIHNGIGDPKQLRLSLIALLHADMAGGSIHGVPLSGTSYDRDGIRSGDPTDPTGDRAARNLDTAGDRDQVHELRTKAEGYARDAANALHALTNVCAAFMQLRDDTANTPAVRYCPCARHREIDNPPVQHTGTVGGRLPEATGLCSDCYEAVRRTAEPGTGKGRLPNRDEIRHHDRNGRWRIVTGAAA